MTVNATLFQQVALGLNTAAAALQVPPISQKNIAPAVHQFQSALGLSQLEEPLRNDVGSLLQLFAKPVAQVRLLEAKLAIESSVINVLCSVLTVFQGSSFAEDYGEAGATAIKESIRLLWDAGIHFKMTSHLAESVVKVVDPQSPGGEVLMYVDDMAILHRAIIRGMSPFKFEEIMTASNGQEGLQLAESNLDRLTAIITDFNMPLMSGDELVRELRQRRPDLPILVITGREENIVPEDHQTWRVMKPILGREIAQHLRLMMILRQAYAG